MRALSSSWRTVTRPIARTNRPIGQIVKRLSIGRTPSVSRANCTTANGANPATEPASRMRARCATTGSLVRSASRNERAMKMEIAAKVAPNPMLRA